MGFLIDTSLWIAIERGRLSAADIHAITGQVATAGRRADRRRGREQADALSECAYFSPRGRQTTSFTTPMGKSSDWPSGVLHFTRFSVT